MAYFLALVVLPAAGLVLLEVSVRIFGPDDLHRQTYDPQLLDERGGRFPYVNRAGWRGRLRDTDVAINSHHLLGPEIVPGDRPRLMLLGDSVFFSPGIDYRDTPGPVLEELLGNRVTVLNVSCIGWSSEHELAFLREFGPDLRPTALVLGYCLNDPMPRSAPSLFGVASAGSRKWSGALVRLNLVLRKHSLAFVWLKAVLGLEKRQNGYDSLIKPLFDDESWSRNREVLLQIVAWCWNRDIPFAVVVFPHRDQLMADGDLQPQRLLEALGKEEGFPVVDVRPALREEDFLFGDPLHLDRNGVRKAMAVVADAVRGSEVGRALQARAPRPVGAGHR